VNAPETGRLIGGKYRVIRELGAGGFGIVLLARHEKLERDVALKLPHPEKNIGRDATSRLLSEARMAAKIRSDHVARVLDVDEDDSQSPYIVLEHLHGKDLAALVRSDGPLSWQTAVDYVVQAADAVLEAHVLGIVHRDLKPSNLFLERGTPSRIKVLDFGIAVEVDRERSDSRSGSPRYMAPEQLGRKGVDERTDVWGLGVTLYELLTGGAPFDAPDLERTLARILNVTPVAPSTLQADIPKELDAIVLRCLEKSPEHRFGSVFSLLEALSELRPGTSARILERARELQTQSGTDPISSRKAPEGGATTLFTQDVAQPSDGPRALGSSTAALSHTLSRVKRKSRLLRVSGALLLLAGGTLLVWRFRTADAPMPTLAHGMVSISNEPAPAPTSPRVAPSGAPSSPRAATGDRFRVQAPVPRSPIAPSAAPASAATGVGPHLLEDRE
jgi:serine/threonine protein kinase